MIFQKHTYVFSDTPCVLDEALCIRQIDTATKSSPEAGCEKRPAIVTNPVSGHNGFLAVYTNGYTYVSYTSTGLVQSAHSGHKTR